MEDTPLKISSAALDGMRGHKMITAALVKKAPALFSQDGKGEEAVVFVKWFQGSWTWYATEFNSVTGEAFGLVQGHEVELGTFNVYELGSIKGAFGMPIERDCYFTPCTIAEARAQCAGR